MFGAAGTEVAAAPQPPAARRRVRPSRVPDPRSNRFGTMETARIASPGRRCETQFPVVGAGHMMTPTEEPFAADREEVESAYRAYIDAFLPAIWPRSTP